MTNNIKLHSIRVKINNYFEKKTLFVCVGRKEKCLRHKEEKNDSGFIDFLISVIFCCNSFFVQLDSWYMICCCLYESYDKNCKNKKIAVRPVGVGDLWCLSTSEFVLKKSEQSVLKTGNDPRF